MKVAVVGTRTLYVKNLLNYLPDNTTEIVSGGARGIDGCARFCAITNHLKITEFFPDYDKFGKSAPLRRNLQIIEYSDEVIVFWDGKSRGSHFVIKNCRKLGKPLKVYLLKGYDKAEDPIYELVKL